jgi:hypothetical protein
MRIGIFGDSYADRNSSHHAWWRKLQSYHGHATTSFGAGGSSILYSAHQIEKHHQNFDFNIWCVTCPGRFSIKISENPEKFWHSTSVMSMQGNLIDKSNSMDQPLINACSNYLKYVFDAESENLLGKSLIHYFQSKIPNLMIIPCFYPPLGAEFNLYKLCELELQTQFPGKDVHIVYQNYLDIRDCHLTPRNNDILAELIAKNLYPGTLQFEYDNFCFDNIPLESMLSPRRQSQ